MPTTSCIGKKIDSSFRGLVLGTCNRTVAATAGIYNVVPHGNATLSYVNIVIENASSANKCLAIKELMNGGGSYGPRGGAQVVLGNCSDPSVRLRFFHLSFIVACPY
jgi:hypothetical protein